MISAKTFARSLIAAFLISTAAARAETVAFESAVYDSLRDLLNPPPQTVGIEGKLLFPGGDAKAPAVVLLHTCSGPGTAERIVGEHLRAQGFATFEFDSLAPRGWTAGQSCGGKLPASPWSQLGDAYAALKVLARHSAIDPARIAVVGASMGGGSAFAAAAEPVRRALAGAGGLRFAAHASFYPGGSTAFHGPGSYTGAPVLLMLGARDDWTPAKRVVATVDFLKKGNPALPVAVRQYDAHHSWLGTAARNHQNTRKSFADCPYTMYAADLSTALLTVNGELVSTPSQDLRSVYTACRTSGATTAGDGTATDKSLADLSEFLGKAMAR